MKHEARATSVSPSEKTIPIDRERTLAAPRFDDKSVQHARPAVPIGRGRASRFGSSAVLAACVVAGLIGGVLGGLALALYQRRNAPAASQPAAIVLNDAEQPSPSSTPTPTSTATSTTTSSPAAASNNETSSPPPTTAATASPPSTDSPANETARPAEDERAPDGNEQAELRAALDQWVAATNARDLGRQMSFYGETVGAFYRTRNVPRAAVRAEKARVFGGAESIDIRAAAPDVQLSPDGQTAVMRFRKRYNIEGGGRNRRGEVLQELRWRRTRDGWKIVGERDLRVLD